MGAGCVAGTPRRGEGIILVLPPSRSEETCATYVDMKHLRDLARQWENITGRERGTVVKQYEAWLKTPTSRFTLDDTA